MADSRKVAEVFEKEHKDVLRRVRNLGTEAAAIGAPEWTERNFAPSSYTDPTGRTLPCIHMTRDGFSLLAMGFTGKRALEFKLGFIKAFNNMEMALAERLAAEHRDRLARTTQLLIDAAKQRDAIASQAEGHGRRSRPREPPRDPDRPTGAPQETPA